MKAFTVFASGLLPLLVSADTISIEDGLGCKTTCGRNTCDVACYRATFTDGGGNVFTTDCGTISGYVPGACPGSGRTQTAGIGLGGGYSYRFEDGTAFVFSANGQYNAECQFPEDDNPAACTLTGDTDPAKRAIQFSG